MLYLQSFRFPADDEEFDFLINEKRQCYESFYPFKILSAKHMQEIQCEPITILYGNNGCGKTTALNVIAETLGIERDAPYNRSSFFEDYTNLCKFETDQDLPEDSRIITSDDVFDYMLNIRLLNEGIDIKREDLFKEYVENKHSKFKMKSLDDYDELKKVNKARRHTQSMYVKESLMDNVITKSNGESGFMYFTNNIKENALYLLDEPENSLAPQKQMELVQFIEESVRFFGCQFIISTHSPFILAMRNSVIYDLDEVPARIRKWTDLKNVRATFEFFMKHRENFER